MTDLTSAVWRKSTRSGDNGGNCVEVATNLPGIVAVRDSKNSCGAALTFPVKEWAIFVRDIAKSRFSDRQKGSHLKSQLTSESTLTDGK